jgi:hypothetical protein
MDPGKEKRKEPTDTFHEQPLPGYSVIPPEASCFPFWKLIFPIYKIKLF